MPTLESDVPLQPTVDTRLSPTRRNGSRVVQYFENIVNHLLFLLDTPFRWLFGRDVFISYSRQDGIPYSKHLVEALKAHKLTYYLDVRNHSR